ncbi:FAD-dependent oxidoreductase [Pyrobaculum neutrophilum]|uniref:FAD-dependent pyridine nucleotide-disulphide oxidoreductase n=1 Tax=Pyrobaculum neutrophilum (strain DSM 2338 / JCM 9278 / NBRC 100436 / V24Sta) TaxID=444157 RepID=B1YBS5_PYRNV|nr:FAD-dependent oxidoreductase [Pyrobaculum neutrophilum]ACB39309.1 FAD-dependent pyridine nucleotide-disulphide oxidoreductase [Pyrobaculum neutrophilum V24Sta]
MVRVVVVGGGIAGIYFTYKLLTLTKKAEVVLVEPNPYHNFVIGVPMAYAGLINFSDLLFPLSSLKRVRHVRDRAVSLDAGPSIRLERAFTLRGDYIVLAPGAYKVGTADYWTVEGAEALYQKIVRAPAVRFVVSEFTPVMGFQELAYSIKTRFPEKDVSIHLVYISDDYLFLLEPWRASAARVGVQVSMDPPPPDGLHISVPAVRPHPIAHDLEVNPATMETQIERVFLIGDSSLLRLGLPPVGWGALWQASAAAQAIASEVEKGYIEVEAEEWSAKDPDKFRQWLTYRMTTGTPLAHLKGLYDLWKKLFSTL